MFAQLVKDLRIKPSVAALSLIATNFKSCDSALNFISDFKNEDKLIGDKKMNHPFIGCLAITQQDSPDDPRS